MPIALASIKVNFDESVKYLYGLGNEVLAMKLGLTSTEKLLAAIGNPQKNYLKVQIAGTNGKGSTCAFLDSICSNAGIKTGLTTSPHLISITERIKVDGEEISEEKFAEHATKIRETSEYLVKIGELENVPTFFEQVTAIAVSVFAEAKVELAILETGLGGRFDSITATRAEIAAITPIDLDHQNILGETLTEIAAEKAAIIREDTKVIFSPQKIDAEKIIYGKCREVKVSPVRAIPNVEIIENPGAGKLYLSFTTPTSVYKAVPKMLGKHQWINAALAIHIAETLRDFNFEISKKDIETGIENAFHKGRLEYRQNILFDGAHNAAGVKAFIDYLEEFVKQPLTVVFGAMRDKNLNETSEMLFPKAENLILTSADNPRSMSVEELLKFLPENFDKKKVHIAPTVEQAIDLARELNKKNQLICITGSLYLVGEAQKILNNKTEV